MLGTNLTGDAQDIASGDNHTDYSNISIEKIGFAQAGLDLSDLQSISSWLCFKHRVEGMDTDAIVVDDAGRAPRDLMRVDVPPGPARHRLGPCPRPPPTNHDRPTRNVADSTKATA